MPYSRKRSYQKKVKTKSINKKRFKRTAGTVHPSGVIFEYAPLLNTENYGRSPKRIDPEKLTVIVHSLIMKIRKNKKRVYKKLRTYRKTSKAVRNNPFLQKAITAIVKNTKKQNKRVGFALVSVGVFLFIFPTAYKASVPVKASLPVFLGGSEATQNSGGEPIRVDGALLGVSSDTYKPVRFVMPRLAIDLDVVEAQVKNGYWELSEKSASHGQGSANPGEKGNTVIFAHARPELFGPIRDAKKDDAIYVFTKERWFKYRIVELKLVNPDQLEVIAPTGDETLTLFTCSGFLDSKRFIAVAKRDNTDLDE